MRSCRCWDNLLWTGSIARKRKGNWINRWVWHVHSVCGHSVGYIQVSECGVHYSVGYRWVSGVHYSVGYRWVSGVHYSVGYTTVWGTLQCGVHYSVWYNHNKLYYFYQEYLTSNTRVETLYKVTWLPVYCTWASGPDCRGSTRLAVNNSRLFSFTSGTACPPFSKNGFLIHFSGATAADDVCAWPPPF